MNSIPNEQSWAVLVEADRQRFASELHDDLLPLILAAKMHVERFRDRSSNESVREELVDLCAEITDAMEAGRRLLVEALPPELEYGTWHTALEHYIHSGLPPTDSKSPATVQLQLHPSTEGPASECAYAAYRIAQEAIRNASQHGAANTILVTSTAVTNNQFQLTVQDNGTGFDVQKVPQGHFGIRSITARAQNVGGQARLHSQIGSGTTVTVRLPLNHKQTNR